MLPTQAQANLSDTLEVHASGLDPRSVQTPQFASNPALGDRARNRDWQGREQQMYYEMRHAPQPHEYSNETPHEMFGGGGGNPLAQYLPPKGPPTGFAARGLSPSHVAAGGRSPTIYGGGFMPDVRRLTPSRGIDRIVGAQTRRPTQYGVTWPNQYYPGGSNTYIPSWEATGLLIKYTRNPTYFRINKYVKELKVPKDQGYYLTLDGDSPYRVQAVQDYYWEDSTDAPGGRQERQGFGFIPYRTARYCYPFSLGKKSVDQAEWPILAEHAAMQACKAMTVRTILMYNQVKLTANWTGTWGTNTSAASGSWSGSSVTNNFIQADINTAMIAIEQATGGIVTDEEALQITLNPVLGRGVSKSGEYKTYIQGSPDALAAITDQRNPNRKYGLAPYLYGLGLVIENAIVVSTPKPGNVPSPPATTRGYIWETANVVITSKPTGITAPDEQTLDFSTCAYRFYEQMTTEQKSDPDNRREVGRVIEDFMFAIQAPQTGYLISGNS